MWPFQRRRSEARPEPARYEPGRGEWRQLPPLQRVVGEQWLVNPADSLTSHLASWRDPSYLAPLGHAVPPDGPSGAIEPAPAAPEPRQIIAEPTRVHAEPRPIGVQRQAEPVRFETPAAPAVPVQTVRSDAVAGPAPVQRVFESDPEPAGPEPVEDRPLLGEDSGPEPSASEPVFSTGVETHAPDLPVRSGPSPIPSSPAPALMPGLQRVASPRAVRPTMPFALQRKLIGDQDAPVPSGGVAAAPLPAPALQTPVVASLLASTDPPERRTLPVASAPRAAKAEVPVSSPAVAVQREAAEVPASAPAVQRETEPMGETAPLLGGLGLAAPMAGDAEAAPLLGGLGLAAPIGGDAEAAPPMLQATTELPVVSPPETPTPPPVAPLIADRPGPEPTAETHTRRLGLGAPLSGLPGGPSVQRLGTEAMPSTPVQRMFSGGTPPPPAIQRLASPESPSNGPSPSPSLSPNPPSPAAPATRPAPPQVMVMRTAASDPAMPVVSRAIDAPGPVYVPADPIPEAPLLGMRPTEIEYADPVQEDRAFSGDAPAPESRSSAPDSPSVQRSPWSHMPKPVQRHQTFAAPRASVPPSSPPSPELPAAPPSSSGAAVPQPPALPAASSWAPVAQRFNAPAPMPVAAAPAAAAPEPAPVIPEAPQPQPVTQVMQRVAAPALAEGAGQAETTAPATAAGAPAAADPGALLALLYEPLVRRLRADLRVDRERRGRLTDL